MPAGNFGEMDFAPRQRTDFGPGTINIDGELCDGCILCSVICPAAMIEVTGSKRDKQASLKQDQDNCMACGCCEAICQRSAIQVTRGYDFGGQWKQVDRGELSLPRRF